MDKELINNLREFRCHKENTLFTRLSVSSFAECKCKKCKKFNYFYQGTTFFLNEQGDYIEYNRSKKGGSLKL